VIIALVIVVVVVSAVLVYVLMREGVSSTPEISITGLNVQIQYPSSEQNYFGASTQTVSIDNPPKNVLEIGKGQQFYISFTLTASALATENHSVNSITATTQGFSVVSVDPVTPITFSPGGSTRITVTFNSPNSNFAGAIGIVLNTT